MEIVFALDIGTRVVIGLVMQKTDTGYEVIASARAEHTQRAMYDGQIHDIREVANVVRQIRKELEHKTGRQLNRVSVAAAGRALSTETGRAFREEPYPIQWEQQDILALEMEAIQEAMAKVASAEMEADNFYCVGYTTVKQRLEGQTMVSLVGQRGKSVDLDVIATFLPRTVVDGLFAVLQHAGLEMATLTLEPIAAGQAAIPADMRRLNMALVDIGAGTADIALTQEGSFFAYGMVPIAGDEVTEAICAQYLLDFHDGEIIKKDLLAKDVIEITNFFGEKNLVSQSELLDFIRPTVQNMAEQIGQAILSLNNNKPQAVIMVGGGSLTPLLGDYLAEVVDLSRNRIGIQIRERINNVFGEIDSLIGPDVVTPLGIGMTALDSQGLHYYSVKVNGMSIPIFELQLATVAEALLAAGIQPRAFLGRPGAALTYSVNGELKLIKGDFGTPAQININGQPAKLDQRVYPDDQVEFNAGYSGNDAQAQIKDVLDVSPRKRIIWNGQEEDFGPLLTLNDNPADEEDWLEDGCKLTFQDNKTLLDLLARKGINFARSKNMVITIDGKEKELFSELEILVNNTSLSENCLLNDHDQVEVREKLWRIRDLLLQPEAMNFIVNEKEFLLPPREPKVLWKGKELLSDDLIKDGMDLRLEGFAQNPILSDLLLYLDLTEEALPGARLLMLVNGHEAHFTTTLKQGDRIVLKWVEE